MANAKPAPEEATLGAVVVCETVEETVALGARFSAGLVGGEVISLEGPLGAGKTHFAKGLARGMGFVGPVSSPTFTLVQEYEGGRLPIYHFDFYRLERAEELVNLAFEDYFDGSGVVIVEWGDRFGGAALPEGAERIRIAVDGASRRFALRRSA